MRAYAIDYLSINHKEKALAVLACYKPQMFNSAMLT